MHYYIVTLKQNRSVHTSIDSLDHCYKSLQLDVSKHCKTAKITSWSSYRGYELDSKQKLHYHTILTTDKGLYFKKLTKKYKGWTIHFQKFPEEDYSKVIQYITKDCQCNDCLDSYETADLCKHEVYTNQGFIPYVMTPVEGASKNSV